MCSADHRVSQSKPILNCTVTLQEHALQRAGSGVEGAGAFCSPTSIAHRPRLGGACQVDAAGLRPVHLGGTPE